ncbi:MAG: PadR family transcriptional regulator [Coriobacteriia bacterium]|nr:PadR family transcriptional regulator [Coriobacteriia bacterium]
MPGQGRRRRCEAADGTHRQLGRGRGALLEPAVLAALADSEAHGYDVRKSIEDMTSGLVSADSGGLYRLLRRLEDDGVVVSTWVEGGSGPQRREYALTAEGRELLAHWLDHLRERERVLSLLVAAVERVVAKD